MASKLPLVLNTDGSIERLQSGDILTGWEPITPTENDFLQYYSGAPRWTSIRQVTAGGTSGQVLTTDGSSYSWQDAGGGGAPIITSPETRYVKTMGNDTTGDGTSGTPWATIDKALEVIESWVLLADVEINIEKGDYSDTSTLNIDHPQGGKLSIVGDSFLDTGTRTASGGSAGSYWYTFSTTNTSEYTVGDYVVVYSASGGSNAASVYGVLNVTSIVAGVSVTLQTKVFATQASGSVVASIMIPQVQWVRPVLFTSSLKNLEGIQLQYNATSTWTYLIQVKATDAGSIKITNSLTVNTNASIYGLNRSFPPSSVVLTKFGARNMTHGWFADDVLWLYNSGPNGCNTGIRAYSGGVVVYVGFFVVGCTTGLYAALQSLIAKGGSTRVLVGNTTDASPALGVEGNQNSWMGA